MTYFKSTKPIDAYDVQMDLARFYSSTFGQSVIQQESSPLLSNDVPRLLYGASPIWVSPDISDALVHAISTFPEDILVEPEDVPINIGFALFAGEPWIVSPQTPSGFTKYGTAFVWTVRKDGVAFCTFGYSEHAGQKVGHETDIEYVGADSWEWGERANNFADIEKYVTSEADADGNVGRYVSELVDGKLVRRYAKASIPEVIDFYTKARLLNRKLILSLWHFMQQKIVAVSRVRASRSEERRMLHNKQYKGEPFVRTVNLRSYEKTEPKSVGTAWHLNKRIIVRGHWRNQPYGPERLERKVIWIEPYLKGPADALLEDRTQLFKVIR